MSDVPSHDRTRLTETELGSDPIARIVAWLEGARAAGVRFPEAAALATADAEGRPAVRHVLVKAVDERGLTFFTNRESRKGRHLAENPNAAMALYWRELDRQVAITGPASRMGDARPSSTSGRGRARRDSAPGPPGRAGRSARGRSSTRRTTKSRSGSPARTSRSRRTGAGTGSSPRRSSFWQGREHRLHDRFRFTREGGGWRVERLWP
jgi:pyridoxamine 5'-phosphate oxidase